MSPEVLVNCRSMRAPEITCKGRDVRGCSLGGFRHRTRVRLEPQVVLHSRRRHRAFNRELRRRDRLPRWNRGGVRPARTAEEEKGGVELSPGTWIAAWASCGNVTRAGRLRSRGGGPAGKPLNPRFLLGRLHRLSPVCPAYPRNSLLRRDACENSHACQHRARPAAPSQATNFDKLASACS